MSQSIALFFFTLVFTERPRNLQSIAFSFILFLNLVFTTSDLEVFTMSDLVFFFFSFDEHYIYILFPFFFSQRVGPQSQDSMSSLDSSP